MGSTTASARGASTRCPNGSVTRCHVSCADSHDGGPPRGSPMGVDKLLQVAGRIPGVSSTLRWWAGRYADGSVVRIRSGLAAGYRWKRYHRYVNGYWIGHYELPIQETLRRELAPGDKFYDVGANAGFFTLV